MRVYFCNDVHWMLPVALLHTDIEGEVWMSADGCWQLGRLMDVGGVLHDLTQHCHKRQEKDKMHPFFSPSFLIRRFPSLWANPFAFPLELFLDGVGAMWWSTLRFPPRAVRKPYFGLRKFPAIALPVVLNVNAVVQLSWLPFERRCPQVEHSGIPTVSSASFPVWV